MVEKTDSLSNLSNVGLKNVSIKTRVSIAILEVDGYDSSFPKVSF